MALRALGKRPEASENVTAAAIAMDARMISADTAESVRLLERYADESRRAAMKGSSIIVLPEKIAVVSESDMSAMRKLYDSHTIPGHFRFADQATPSTA